MKEEKNKEEKPKGIKNNTKVVVSMPDEVKIELVQANELRHYELFQWLVALLLPVAAGFWTAYFTGEKKPELLWSAVIFTLLSGVFVFLAVWYRKKVFHGSIRMYAELDSFRKESEN